MGLQSKRRNDALNNMGIFFDAVEPDQLDENPVPGKIVKKEKRKEADRIVLPKSEKNKKLR